MYLYNSATHKKAEFTTHTPGHVEMYTCGPTVYHFAHIGNLRSYIMEDVLEKYLRYAGYDVNRVMNITDVGHLSSDADTGEDKMLKGAKREHKTVMEIAQFYTCLLYTSWDDALDTLPDPGEQIDRFLSSKLRGGEADEAAKRRLTGALVRRGFSWGDIRAAWNRLGTEMSEE